MAAPGMMFLGRAISDAWDEENLAMEIEVEAGSVYYIRVNYMGRFTQVSEEVGLTELQGLREFEANPRTEEHRREL